MSGNQEECLKKLNQAGSMDFMHEKSTDGRAFKLFNMTDDHNRKELTAILISHCLLEGGYLSRVSQLNTEIA